MKYSLSKTQATTIIKKIRAEIYRYFKANKLEYAIFGKSEGLDSSVVAGLLSDIPGVKPIGVLMPAESNPDATRIGRLVLDHYKIPYILVDLTNEFHRVASALYEMDGVGDQLIKILKTYRATKTIQSLPHKKARALGNVKARLRMITLYHIAQLTGGLVISTDNYSEYWMGFWTLNGDVGDFAPIQQIFKGIELYPIAKALGVPKASLVAEPTDGLDIIPGGIDQDQLKLPYKDLDQVIIELLRRKFDKTGDLTIVKTVSMATGISEPLVQHVAQKLSSSAYKRRVPIHVRRERIGLQELPK